mmetsp:Transcript_21745/g.39959  ORF Transcript_21745/g.39959 Transcript_21745/m.39959 type:complete len:281 (+) Transcript_21745:984-1826(+)
MDSQLPALPQPRPQHQQLLHRAPQQHLVLPLLLAQRYGANAEVRIGTDQHVVSAAVDVSTAMIGTLSAFQARLPQPQRLPQIVARIQLKAQLLLGQQRHCRKLASAHARPQLCGMDLSHSTKVRRWSSATRTLEMLSPTSLLVVGMATLEVTVEMNHATVVSTHSLQLQDGRLRYPPQQEGSHPTVLLHMHSSAMVSSIATAGQVCRTSAFHFHSRQMGSHMLVPSSRCCFGPMVVTSWAYCHQHMQRLVACTSSFPLCKMTIPTIGTTHSSSRTGAGTT